MKKNLILLCSLFMATALISSCAQVVFQTVCPE